MKCFTGWKQAEKIYFQVEALDLDFPGKATGSKWRTPWIKQHGQCTQLYGDPAYMDKSNGLPTPKDQSLQLWDPIVLFIWVQWLRFHWCLSWEWTLYLSQNKGKTTQGQSPNNPSSNWKQFHTLRSNKKQYPSWLRHGGVGHSCKPGNKPPMVWVASTSTSALIWDIWF